MKRDAKVTTHDPMEVYTHTKRDISTIIAMLFVHNPLSDGQFTHQAPLWSLAYSVKNHCSFINLSEGKSNSLLARTYHLTNLIILLIDFLPASATESS